MNSREEAWQKDVEAVRSDLAQLRTDLSVMGETVKDIVGEFASTRAGVGDNQDGARAGGARGRNGHPRH